MNKNAVGTAGADQDVLTRLADVIQSWPTLAFAEIEDLRRQLAEAHAASTKLVQESWHRFAFADRKPTADEMDAVVKQALGSVRVVAYANAYGIGPTAQSMGCGPAEIVGATWSTMWQAADAIVDHRNLIGTVALVLIKPKE
jgi:hypothetical protein